MSLQNGELLAGRYRIGQVLGKGGFGAVYLATDESLGLPCAVKENLSVSPETERQFRREANLLANLRHPNLPRVTNHFVLGDQQYLVMDYVEGEDLKQRLLRVGGLSEAQVMPWALQICDALNYLHNHTPPIIHRDIKPANIKLTASEEAMLVDFGLAKASAPGQQTTTSAMGLSPGFAPPEQYGLGGTDQRSDEYAFAATLYNLFTGKMPCDSMERLLGHDTLTPLAELRPDLSPHVVTAITRALSIPPHYRFPSIADFRAALLGEVHAAVTSGAGTRPLPRLPEAMNQAAPTQAAATMVRAPSETRVPASKRGHGGLVIGLVAVVAAVGLVVALAAGLSAPLWVPLVVQLMTPRSPTAVLGPTQALATEMMAPTAIPAAATLPEATVTPAAAQATPTAPPSSPPPPSETIAAPATSSPAAVSASSAPYLARLAELGSSGLVPFALSPDGKSVALTNADGIDIVALATGEKLQHLNAFWGKTPILAVAYLSDSLLIEAPDVINRWDFKSGTFRKYPLTGHALFVSANGQRMVVPHDKYGQVLDIESGALLFNKGNPGSYYQFTPDGAYLAWADPGDQPGSTNLVNWVTVASPQVDRVLAGHGKPLRALTVSPDGKWLISASGDVWDTATGKLTVTFDCSADKVAVSADSQVILGLDGEVYSVANGKELGRLAQPLNATQLAFTPDGLSLLVQTADNTVEVWAVATQQMAAAAAGPMPTAVAQAAASSEVIALDNAARLTLQGWWGGDRLLEARLVRDAAGAAKVFGPAQYTHVAFSADGTKFVGVTASDVDVVDLASGRAVGQLSGLSSPQEAVFLGDRFLLITTANGVERWDLQTNTLKQTYTISGHALTVSPDGKKFALQDDRFVSVVDGLTGEAVQASSDPHCDFAFTPDGHYLASTIGLNVALWDVTANTQKILAGQRGVKTAGLAFSPDGKELLTATGDVWDWDSGKWLRKFDGAASRLAVSADGQLLVESDGSLFETASGKLIGSLLDMRGPADALVFVLGGSRLLWHTPAGQLYVWGVAAAAAAPTPAAGAPDAISSVQPLSLTLQARWGKGKLYSAQWSPDEKYLAVNTSLNTIIYQGDSLAPVQTLWGATTLAVGTAGQAAVVGPAGLKLLEVATGREVGAWPLPGVTAAAFSADGSTLALAGQVVDAGKTDGVALLNLSDGSVRVLSQGWGAYKAVLGANFSADGKYLATSFRGAILIWDVAEGKQARPPILNATLPAQFSPDGQYLAYCTDRQMVIEGVVSGHQVLVTNLDGTPYFAAGHDIDPLVPLSQRFVADGSLVVIYQTQRAHTVTLVRWKTDAASMPETLHSDLVGLDGLRGFYAELYDQDHVHHLPALELSPAGNKFYSLTADGAVRVWDFGSGQQIAATAPDYLETMALSPDGQTVALADATGGLDLLDLKTGQVGQTIAGAWYPRALAYDSPSVLMLLYPGSRGDGDHLAAVDLAQKDVIEDLPGDFYSAIHYRTLSG